MTHTLVGVEIFKNALVSHHDYLHRRHKPLVRFSSVSSINNVEIELICHSNHENVFRNV